MKVIKTIEEARREIGIWRKQGLTVGLVPTMGYLHNGHKSLIEKAKAENDKVVVSVFVNPIQFGPTEDLDKYPRDIERDSVIAEEAGASFIFNPEPAEMYKSTFSTYVDCEGITEGLCGSKRPGHFQGVCTVVSKLFNIIKPNRAYFGEKDAQQLAVIKRMVRDLNFDVEIVPCPIVREEDGLAMSSRNVYLSQEERRAALILSKSLTRSKELLKNGEKETKKILEEIIKVIETESLSKIDYVEIVDSEDLAPVSTVEKPVLIALAVFIGKVRLIDNFTFIG
ncbi:pantoate--beta-alanine ligase [Clostridium cellulovorans]|uniref:Pantothenate synthetase n=1 Tax=Clostridium cellulovorans (strain ATCC 35296 / DSM 3052 / OCM 3 / 743B) TaxID=573061 RepID=D9SXD6_CLOC7|nr:pantoate--beta-alanine ligase [Clostridium cellulovorans]ADL53439.1 pantoate/beta-alanine ligase [Clostridium cellulovorans 743B]